jgi:hypothetical protein
MKCVQYLAPALAFIVLAGPIPAGADVATEQLRAQFEAIIQGLNNNSFEKFDRAIVKKDMISRIYGSRLIEPEVKKAFTSDFSASIQQMFTSAFPKTRKEILGTVIDFKFEGDEGRAIVRYVGSGYRYSYHVYELRQDSKERLVIVDWVDYYQGSRFSDEAGAALVMAMPSKAATRNMLENKNLGDSEIFQAAELFKAVRDNKPERFFQIADSMNADVLRERVIARLGLQFALTSRDSDRLENAVRALVDTYPDDPLYSLKLIEYYIPTRQYQNAIDGLVTLQQGIGVQDGATESLKASAALAMGDTGDAEKFALQATVVEPGLELAWWSLLRARTRSADYDGATEALTRLEEDFGHTLDAKTLKRDQFLKILADKTEYLDWRAARE